MDQIELIKTADRWQEEGRALREELVKERAALAIQIAEIDKRLAMIPVAGKSPTNGSSQNHLAIETSIGSSTDSISTIIRNVLKASTRPMFAAEIIVEVEKVRHGRRATIHSILNQLKGKGHVQSRKQGGKHVFTWKESNQA